VVLELREERRRAGMGAARIGRGPRPFIGVGGRQRCRSGFNGQYLMVFNVRSLKTLVTGSEEPGGGGGVLRPNQGVRLS
jgi:hypothetical protein